MKKGRTTTNDSNTTHALSLATKTQRRSNKPHTQWRHDIRQDRVARRMYQGVSDFICISTDWFGSWMMDPSKDKAVGAEAILYLGHLVRYGYWTSDQRLAMDGHTEEMCRLASITTPQHDQYMTWLVKSGLMTRVDAHYYTLNPETVRLGNNPIV